MAWQIVRVGTSRDSKHKLRPDTISGRVLEGGLKVGTPARPGRGKAVTRPRSGDGLGDQVP
jgi:hypothetical protein